MKFILSQNSNSLAPFVPTPLNVVKKMLKLAKLKQGETLFDLGSGDGRIVLMAANDFGAFSFGVEHKIALIEEARAKADELGLSKTAQFIHESIFKANLSSADVVTIYLTTRSNERIRPKLERELKQGSRVVTHNFPIFKWNTSEMTKVYEAKQIHTLYLYACKFWNV
jgi:cyclopropane fatty-acyl-phospholipid synthase-like methyltransferase